VDNATQGGQTPWVNEAIIGSFAINGTVAEPQPVKVIQALQQPEPTLQPQTTADPSSVPLPDIPSKIRRDGQPDFILPDSATRRLGWQDISGLSAARWWPLIRFHRRATMPGTSS